MNTFDVVVVGAGPVGLSLALGLANAGKKICLIEKQEGLSPHSRAPAIWPRTQEVLADLGVIDTFLNESIVIRDPKFWDADTEPNEELLHVPFHELESQTSYPQILIIPQEKTERLLLAALKKFPSTQVQIDFSSELKNFSQSEKYVEVTYSKNGQEQQVRSQFLSGCDGAHSRVREILGFHLEGITYPILAALSDVRLKDNKDYPFPRFSTRGINAVAIKIEKDLWRLILLHEPKSKLNLDEQTRMAVQQLFHQTEYTSVWQSDFRLHRRLSTGFVKGRVALAGDSAHLNSPVGGQGMNAGIQDTQFLSRALIECLNYDSVVPLQNYERERKEGIGLGVNQFTNQLTRMLLVGNGNFLKLILKTANKVMKFKPFRQKFLRRATMLDTRP